MTELDSARRLGQA